MKVHANPTEVPNFMRGQDDLASKMAQHFKSLRNDVTAEGPWNDIQTALEVVIVHNRLTAYTNAALLVGKHSSASDYIRLKRDGVARAEWVTSEMKGWTRESLQASKKSKLLSSKRANKVAIFESRKASFDGSIKGWRLNRSARKEWFTSDAHDQDDICDDCEDDGIIDMGEAFSSGDMTPPAHLFCMCTLWIHL